MYVTKVSGCMDCKAEFVPTDPSQSASDATISHQISSHQCVSGANMHVPGVLESSMPILCAHAVVHMKVEGIGLYL